MANSELTHTITYRKYLKLTHTITCRKQTFQNIRIAKNVFNQLYWGCLCKSLKNFDGAAVLFLLYKNMNK
jgi:hypothetical protein